MISELFQSDELTDVDRLDKMSDYRDTKLYKDIEEWYKHSICIDIAYSDAYEEDPSQSVFDVSAACMLFIDDVKIMCGTNTFSEESSSKDSRVKVSKNNADDEIQYINLFDHIDANCEEDVTNFNVFRMLCMINSKHHYEFTLAANNYKQIAENTRNFYIKMLEYIKVKTEKYSNIGAGLKIKLDNLNAQIKNTNIKGKEKAELIERIKKLNKDTEILNKYLINFNSMYDRLSRDNKYIEVDKLIKFYDRIVHYINHKLCNVFIEKDLSPSSESNMHSPSDNDEYEEIHNNLKEKITDGVYYILIKSCKDIFNVDANSVADANSVDTNSVADANTKCSPSQRKKLMLNYLFVKKILTDSYEMNTTKISTECNKIRKGIFTYMKFVYIRHVLFDTMDDEVLISTCDREYKPQNGSNCANGTKKSLMDRIKELVLKHSNDYKDQFFADQYFPLNKNLSKEVKCRIALTVDENYIPWSLVIRYLEPQPSAPDKVVACKSYTDDCSTCPADKLKHVQTVELYIRLAYLF